jgi:hypothetical protein
VALAYSRRRKRMNVLFVSGSCPFAAYEQGAAYAGAAFGGMA